MKSDGTESAFLTSMAGVCRFVAGGSAPGPSRSSPPPSGQNGAVRIEMVVAGTDPGIVARVTEIVNQAYEEGEKGLWIDGVARTSAAEVAELIGRGEIAAATSGGRVMGCVRVRRLAPELAEFGMLAADPTQRGGGVGRALVGFAEDWARAEGIAAMRLELLVPVDGEHPVKEFLRAWYTRLGYRQVGTGRLDEDYPELAAHLAVPARLLRFHKDL